MPEGVRSIIPVVVISKKFITNFNALPGGFYCWSNKTGMPDRDLKKLENFPRTHIY